MVKDLAMAVLMAANPEHVVMTEYYAAIYNVPVKLFHAIIIVESRYKPLAVNLDAPVKSYGLTQLTKATAEHHCRLSFEKIMVPEENIKCGAKVLSYQLNRYKGDIYKTISAYNAGTFTTKNSEYVRLVKERINQQN